MKIQTILLIGMAVIGFGAIIISIIFDRMEDENDDNT